jgi:hypothetical protein
MPLSTEGLIFLLLSSDATSSPGVRSSKHRQNLSLPVYGGFAVALRPRPLAPRSAYPSYFGRVLTVALIAALLGASPAGASRTGPSALGARAEKTKVDKKTAAQRARERRLRQVLARRLKRNPLLALSKSFIKKADLLDFRLPLTVRLTDGNGGLLPTDDTLEINWDDSVSPWPVPGVAPAPQTLALTGRFSMELSYGDDATGYGELGALESLQGASIRMQATPFAISDFPPPCASGPQLRVPPGDGVDITSAGARYGLLNPYSQRFRGSLMLRMTFATEGAASCGGAYDAPTLVDNSTAPPMPVRFDGSFRTSPAITADGNIRFGEITIDDATTPQPSTFAFVRACTVAVTCNAQQFPARLKLKKLTAEVLLGDVS